MDTMTENSFKICCSISAHSQLSYKMSIMTVHCRWEDQWWKWDYLRENTENKVTCDNLYWQHPSSSQGWLKKPVFLCLYYCILLWINLYYHFWVILFCFLYLLCFILSRCSYLNLNVVYFCLFYASADSQIFCITGLYRNDSIDKHCRSSGTDGRDWWLLSLAETSGFTGCSQCTGVTQFILAKSTEELFNVIEVWLTEIETGVKLDFVCHLMPWG